MGIPNKVSILEVRDKPYKVFDALGLYLIVRPSGRHWWRFRYRFDGMEKTLSLGVYPDVGLSAARSKRDDARRLIAEEGIDPSENRKEEKAAREIAKTGTFRAVAEEWLDAGCPGSQRSKGGPSDETIKQLRARLEKYVFGRIGHKPMVDIKLADVRGVLAPMADDAFHL